MIKKELEENVEAKWSILLKKLNDQFGDIDMQGILFLIGVQELGKGYKKLKKDEKLDVMHIAICTLLAPYGYYELEGLDADGWPHWKRSDKLPYLKAEQQEKLMKEAIVDYFGEDY